MNYSNLTGGFYPDHAIAAYEAAGTLPNDLVRITEEHARALITGKASGKIIVADSDGNPVLSDPMPVDPQIIIAAKLSAVRAVREDILNRLAGIALASNLTGDTATTGAYVTVRQGLLDITKDLPDDIDSAIRSRYATLCDQCTPQMRSAFAQVDA